MLTHESIRQCRETQGEHASYVMQTPGDIANHLDTALAFGFSHCHLNQ